MCSESLRVVYGVEENLSVAQPGPLRLFRLLSCHTAAMLESSWGESGDILIGNTALALRSLASDVSLAYGTVLSRLNATDASF